MLGMTLVPPTSARSSSQTFGQVPLLLRQDGAGRGYRH